MTITIPFQLTIDFIDIKTFERRTDIYLGHVQDAIFHFCIEWLPTYYEISIYKMPRIILSQEELNKNCLYLSFNSEKCCIFISTKLS